MKKMLLTLPIALVILLIQTSQAHAWSIQLGYNEHKDNQRVVIRQPVYKNSTHARERFVHEKKIIFKRLPYGYQRVWINGQPYFHCQGNYYIAVFNGFQLVHPPVIVRTEPIYYYSY